MGLAAFNRSRRMQFEKKVVQQEESTEELKGVETKDVISSVGSIEETKSIEEMTVRELTTYARKNEIKLKVAAKKDDILEAIQEYEKKVNLKAGE